MSFSASSRSVGLRVGGVALCSASLLLAACGSSGPSPEKASAGLPKATTQNAAIIAGLKKDPAAAALVPASWRSKGAVTVAMDGSYAPDSYLASDHKTLVGWNPDLGYALARILGLKFKMVNVTFDAILPGLAAHRYDIGMSSFGVTPEREKAVDFVTYFQGGSAFLINADSKIQLNGLSRGLCGRTVAAQKGSTQVDLTQQQSKECTGAGDKPIKLLVYPDQNAVNLAVSSRRAEVGFSDSTTVAWQVKVTGGKFKQAGPLMPSPHEEGIALAKDNGGLDKALQAAMNKLIASGAARKILGNWGLESATIPRSQINPKVTA